MCHGGKDAVSPPADAVPFGEALWSGVEGRDKPRAGNAVRGVRRLQE